MTKRELEVAVQEFRLQASAANKIIDEQSKNIKWFSRETDSLRGKIAETENANKKLSAELSALHRAIADDFIYRTTMRMAKNIVKVSKFYHFDGKGVSEK